MSAHKHQPAKRPPGREPSNKTRPPLPSPETGATLSGRQAEIIGLQRSRGNRFVQALLEGARPQADSAAALQRQPKAGEGIEHYQPPPGRYTGARKRNDLMDPYEFKQNFFAPPLFRRYGPNQALWEPLKGLLDTYWVKNHGDQAGIRLDSPVLKQAAWNLLNAVASPKDLATIRENAKAQGEETALLEAVFVEHSKQYPPAQRRAQAAWRKSDFALFHEWAAAEFEFVKKPFAYWGGR